MEGTRIEINKNGVWTELYLGQKNKVKYNKVVNRIGEIGGRKIGHSNTLTIPKNYQNIKALDLNEFNRKQLAKSLNTKYEAKYYVEDRLFQNGFVVINSTKGSIKINFINSALDILDKWGTESYSDVLNNLSPNVESEYLTAVSEMKNFYLPKDSQVGKLSNLENRDYPLALFPNNLNTIGNNFNKVRVQELNDQGETVFTDLVGRRDNGFNPYQSRPIFNSFALLELACQQYEYEAVFDDSVDIESLKKTYIVSKNLGSTYSGNELRTENKQVFSNTPRLTVEAQFNPEDNSKFDIITAQAYSNTDAISPNSLPQWFPPESFTNTDYENLRTIYKPDLSDNFLGEVQFNFTTQAEDKRPYKVYSVWEGGSGTTFFLEMDTTPSGSGYSVKKAQLLDNTVGTFIGIINFIEEVATPGPDSTLSALSVTETFLPSNVLELDEDQQYTANEVDLTHAASTESIKTILKSILEKDGILMDIENNSINRKVTFFTYAKYEREIIVGRFTNLDKYLLKYNDFDYNTKFGNRYGVVNKLSLQSPYPGNEATILLNSDIESKLKEESINRVPKMKDVSNVLFVSNSNTPYFEYTNTGLGMVELTGYLGSLDQIRSKNNKVGTIFNLPALANVNYSKIPSGQSIWYKIVNESIKAEPLFLMPPSVAREIDITKPVYLSELGGYYIIEEMQEYVDESTPFKIKLIKVSPTGEFNNAFSNAFNNR